MADGDVVNSTGDVMVLVSRGDSVDDVGEGGAGSGRMKFEGRANTMSPSTGEPITSYESSERVWL